MALFTAVPAKKSSEVDLVGPLKALIANYYGNDEAYVKSIQELNNLRKNCTYKGIDHRQTATLTALQKYYDQLAQFTKKCPVNDVPINFKWKDAFDKGGSFLLGSASFVIPSLSYESVCVLFNIAACLSDIAATSINEDVKNEHALQLAAKNFQAAAGIFLELKALAPAAIGSRSNAPVDLNSSVLHILHQLMLAQAQESIFLKAMQNMMTDAILAKIASACAEMYIECLKLIQVIKSIWPEKEWISAIEAKSLAYTGIAEFHQATLLANSKSFGEEISRLQAAVECFHQSRSKCDRVFGDTFQSYLNKATKQSEACIKDNDFIYHDRVPDYRHLEPIQKTSLARPTPLPAKFTSEATDLFDGLLPLNAQYAWKKLESRKHEIAGAEIKKLQESTTDLNGLLASLNLPASLEDAPGVDLPQSLQDKAKYVRQKGGIGNIKKLINELPELLTRNKEILDEIEASIRNEERQDDEQRVRFGARWSRATSASLNHTWKDYIKKYRDVIQSAMSADNKVKEKFITHEQQIALLSSDSKSAIADAIPSGYHGHNYSNAPCALRLKQLMDSVNRLKSERDQLIQQFKDADFSGAKKRFTDLADDPSFNEAALVAESLGQVFGPMQNKVHETIQRQEELIKEIKSANSDFVDLKGGTNSAASARDVFFSKLAAAYDAYDDLLRHLREGTQFYNDFTHLLVTLQTKVDDFCYARRTEKDELVKSLDPTAAQSHHSSDAASGGKGAGGAGGSAGGSSSGGYYYPPPPLPTMPFAPT